jgi:hypothetical protein
MYEEILVNSSILNNDEHPGMVLDALGVTIAVTWPRLSAGSHVLDIIRIMAMCWLSVLGNETTTSILIRAKLQQIWELLLTIVFNEANSESGMVLSRYAIALRTDEPLLQPLFHSVQ